MKQRRLPQSTKHRELTNPFVLNAKPPEGKLKAIYRDTLAKNLALQVTATINRETGEKTYARSYVFVYKGRQKVRSANGNEYFPVKWMGLGSIHDKSLAEAREKAKEYRRQLVDGVDPFIYREATKPVVLHALRVVAMMYHEAHKNEWSNERYQRQWLSQLEQHIFAPPDNKNPLGDMPINHITTAEAHAALKGLWQKSPKTANDLRGRLEQIWYYAKAMKWVVGENPFIMKGNLQPLLADISKRDVEHQPSLPYEQLPQFMVLLAKEDDLAARAVEFGIRTNLRTEPVINARWPDINLAMATWTVPARYVKGKKGQRQPFLCPLSPQCIKLLEGLPSYKRRNEPNAFVFAHADGKRIGMTAMLNYVDRYGLVDPRELDADGNPKPITMHGFRSSFADWAYDTTDYTEAVIEPAMQHVVTKKVKAAYRRGDAFMQRQSLMCDFSNYLDSGKKKGGA